MTALGDIKARIAALEPVPTGWARVLFIGVSARGSIIAERHREGAHDKERIPPRLCGLLVREMPAFDEFKGWEIKDCDPAGQYHDALSRQPTSVA